MWLQQSQMTSLTLNELFMPHPTLGNYAANHLGDVVNVTTGCLLKGIVDNGGYSSFSSLVLKSGQTMSKKRHVLVWEAFHDLVQTGYHIHHVDGLKLNNRLSNLQCLTSLEHHRETERMNPQRKEKTAAALSRAIVATCLNTGASTEYISIHEAGRQVAAFKATKICAVLKGRRKTHAGHKFAYVHVPDLPDEVWASLRRRGFRAVEVSSKGRIRSKNGVVSFGTYAGGYMRTFIRGFAQQVHILICEAFHGFAPSQEHTVDHIDRNRVNNAFENLQWATHREQSLNSSRVKAVQAINVRGELVGAWDTTTAAAKATGCDISQIAKACKGHISSKVKDLVWSYARRDGDDDSN